MFKEEDYQAAATALGCDVPIVKAFAEVESNGVTHWADGRVPLLFEAQWFHKFTNGAYDASHPGISSPVWDRSLYKGGYAEYDRLAEAAALDATAAAQSASYGAFQIMGFNFSDLGYPSVEAFVAAMQTDAGQLDGFVRYIKANRLETALKNHDAVTLALRYNGSGAVDEYSTKILDALALYQGGAAGIVNLKQGSQGADVVRLQQALAIEADGIFGPATDAAAVRVYQAPHGLVADGIVGALTRKALGL